MPKYGPCVDWNIFECVRCSIYVIKYSIFLIFEDLQTTHFLTNLTESFENNAIVSVLKYLSYTGKYLGQWQDIYQSAFPQISNLVIYGFSYVTAFQLVFSYNWKMCVFQNPSLSVYLSVLDIYILSMYLGVNHKMHLIKVVFCVSDKTKRKIGFLLFSWSFSPS